MKYREIMVVYCGNHMLCINTVCGQNGLFSVIDGHTYSNDQDLNELKYCHYKKVIISAWALSLVYLCYIKAYTVYSVSVPISPLYQW